MSERQQMKEYKVDVIAPTGLGYGEGSISVADRLDRNELDLESLQAAVDIVTNDPDIFVPVEADDDGCGDGRGTARIYRFLNPATGEIQEFKKSLNRAKLFGGGLIATSSMWRMVDDSEDGKTLDGDREYIAAKLEEAGIPYGAHTDNHAKGEKCGCGAIDLYKEISENIVNYEENIRGTLQVLYGNAYEENIPAINVVFDKYRSLSETYYGGTTGKSTMKFIEKDGAVIKQLDGPHLEGLTAINDEEDTTLDQEMLREKLVEKGLSPDIQIFVVDTWRGKKYANFIADLAEENGQDRETAYAIAFADFLIRTCAVSATLTAGDQPVIRRSVKQADYSLAS